MAHDRPASAEPVQISSRFTLTVFARDRDERPVIGGLILAAILDDPSFLANPLTIRLTDLDTGRTVDDEIGQWNAQADADFDQAADALRQMSDDEILAKFFEPPSE